VIYELLSDFSPQHEGLLCGRKEGYQESSAWIHQGEIMPDQSDSTMT